MRFFIAGLVTETNGFAPLPTGAAGFETSRREPPEQRNEGSLAEVLAGEARGWVIAAGHEVAAESVFAFAQPSGRTIAAVYESLRDEILRDLSNAVHIDAVLLNLHGAMLAVGYDDCEGDLLARVRAIVGPGVPVGAVLDPHMHLTDRMVANADALVLLKEYPHTDGDERGAELCRILEGCRNRSIEPVSAVFDCRMVGSYPTTTEPMRSFVQRMKDVEREPGVLSVSLVHGFPWADVAEVGTRMLVIANRDMRVAQHWAETLGREMYALRERLVVPLLNADAALDIAAREPGLSVIADVSDNAGGGAPGDNTHLLRCLLRRRLDRLALGALYDPVAVELCFEAGVGARFDLRLGGKLGRSSDAPLDATVTVMRLAEDLVQTFFTSMTQSMGRCAAVEIDGVRVLLCSRRVQTFAPHIFEDMGIALAGLRGVVVKSTQHFEEGFGPLAARILRVTTPGAALDMSFGSLPYTQRNSRYFPRVADPLGDDRPIKR